MSIVLTVACPEADHTDANHLAVALGWIEGWSPDEWEYTFTSQFQDDAGNLYRVMSCPVGEGFAMSAVGMGPIERPEEDVEPYRVDLKAARRAQAKLTPWAGEGPIPQASPETIVAISGLSGTDALTAMGLRPLDEVV
jgi:hypothetical protein